MAERKIQLASNLDSLSAKRRNETFEYGGYASEKLDGVWAALHVTEHGAYFESSSGEHIPSLEFTTAQTEATRYLPHGVYLGELWHPELEQRVISGLARKKKAGHAEQLEFHIHDLIHTQDYAEGKTAVTYDTRLFTLKASLFPEESNHVFTKLKLIRQEFCRNETDFSLFEKQLPKTAEGAIFKPALAEWEIGNRGINVVRIKRTLTFDLEVIGVTEVSRTEKGGLTGGINVLWRRFGRSEGPKEWQTVRGMSHAELEAWAADPSLIVGKIVEVEAMNITPLGYLREPRFKAVREDKFEADL